MQNNELSRLLNTRTKRNIITHVTLNLHYILLSCNIYHPFTDGAFDTSDSEYLQTTVLHAPIPFIILQTRGIITPMLLIKPSDNADV